MLSDGPRPEPVVNTLEYLETEKRRSLKANLTDDAVRSLADAITGTTGNFGVQSWRERRRSAVPTSEQGHEQLALPDSSRVQEGAVSAANESSIMHTQIEDRHLQRIFRRDGERFQLMESRLKASGKGDYMQRLTYLYLYANHRAGRDPVARSDLNGFLKDQGVYDGNTRKWLASSPNLAVDSEAVGLLNSGLEEAQRILSEVLDNNVPNDWTPGTSRQGRTAKPSNSAEDVGESTAGKSGRRKGRSASKRVAAWLSSWRDIGSNIDWHDALKDRSVLDQGIVGLWAIRRVAEDKGKEVSRSDLAWFVRGAFDLMLDERNLARSLKKQAVQDKRVINPHGDTFQITPSGLQ